MQTETKQGITRKYDNGWCGAGAIYQGLRAVQDGEQATVTFVVADHHTEGDKVYHRATIGRAKVEGVLCWRWCGEGGKPDANGSHAVCASWSEQDLALACAVVACALVKYDGWVYRQ